MKKNFNIRQRGRDEMRRITPVIYEDKKDVIFTCDTCYRIVLKLLVTEGGVGPNTFIIQKAN